MCFEGGEELLIDSLSSVIDFPIGIPLILGLDLGLWLGFFVWLIIIAHKNIPIKIIATINEILINQSV